MRIRIKIKVIIIGLLLFLPNVQILRAKLGYPYIINFFDPSKRYFSANVNDFTFLPNGLIVAASCEGVLFYDGNSWFPIGIDGNFMSIAYDSISNKIFLGTDNSFGYLDFDYDYNMYFYKHLSILISEKVKNVWYIVPTNNGIYFFVNKKNLYLYDLKNIKKINTSKKFYPSRGFYVKGQLFVVDDSSGIGKVVDNKIIRLTDNEIYNHESIRVFLPTNKSNEFIFFTKEAGVYKFDLSKNHIIPIMQSITKELKGVEVYTGNYLNDSIILLGTLNNGLYLISLNGYIKDHLTVNQGLSCDQINRIGLDFNKKVIYLATNRFFNSVLYSYPFRFYNESTGFRGNIADYKIWRDNLFVATNIGLFITNIKEENYFRLFKDNLLFYRKSLELMKFPNGREILLAGSLRELFVIDERLIKHSLLRFYNIYSIKQSYVDPYRFYALSFDSLYVFKFNKNLSSINIIAKMPLSQLYESIHIDKKDNIIGITQTNKSLFRLFIDYKEKSLKEKVINSDMIIKSLHVLDDSIFIVLTNSGLFNLNSNLDNLVVYNKLLESKLKSDIKLISDFYPEKDKITLIDKKRLIFYDFRLDTIIKLPLISTSWSSGSNLSKNGDYLLYAKPFELGVVDLKLLASGHFRNENEKPLLAYIKIGDYVYYNFNTNSIFENKDSIYKLKYNVPYSSFLSFNFSLVNSLPFNALYSYYLSGYSKTWSEWTENNIISYNSLFPKKYKLRVRVLSKTTGKIYNLEILFRVKPPFYLSYYALVLYALIILIIIIVAIKLSTRHHNIATRRLERLVRRRTKELEVKNKILEQNNILLNKLTEELKSNKEELWAQNERLKLTNLELKQLSLVAQYTNNAVMILDNKGRIEWWNKSFAKLFNYKFKMTKNIVIPKAVKIIRPDVFERLLSFEADFKSITYTTHELISDQKEERWYQTTITAVRDDTGKIYRFVVLDVDITDLKKAEREIIKHRDKLENQTKKLKEMNQELRESRKKLLQQHKDMLASLEYAKRLQSALLSEEIFNKLFPEGFIFYLPKEIVSGDFYLFDKRMNKVIFAVGDATGHGVPGAFMSILGITFLKEAIEKNEHSLLPNRILETLRASVIKALHNNIVSSDIKDGMDIGVGVIDYNIKRLFFSGANISLNIIRDKDLLIEIRADRMPIGIKDLASIPFNLEVFALKEGDRIYLYSDGFIDQFGGKENKRFKRRKFKNLLLNLQEYPMEKQNIILQEKLDAWMNSNEQVDDILVVGFKVDFENLQRVEL